MINGQETLAFLQKLISEPAYQYVSDEELLLQLKDVITNDNFCSAEISEPHYLRGLAESEKVTSGPEFIESLILVATCIICAGLASGLTQVCL